MKLKSNIDPNSEAFAKNAAHHRGLAPFFSPSPRGEGAGGGANLSAFGFERGVRAQIIAQRVSPHPLPPPLAGRGFFGATA